MKVTREQTQDGQRASSFMNCPPCEALGQRHNFSLRNFKM